MSGQEIKINPYTASRVALKSICILDIDTLKDHGKLLKLTNLCCRIMQDIFKKPVK